MAMGSSGTDAVASTIDNLTSPPPTPSRVKWFSGGVVAGALLTLLIGAMGTPSGGAIGSRTVNYSAVAELVALVSQPLVAQGQERPDPSEAEVLAAISSHIATADTLARRFDGSDVGSIAREYGDALRTLQHVVAEAPSPQPLIEEGLGAWQSSLRDDKEGFLIGLLGVGAELSKFGESTRRMNSVHQRVVACRLRAAEILSGLALKEGTENTVSSEFKESRGWGTIESDTLFVTNVSGVRLTKVALRLELTGASGETFSNCFYKDSWEPKEVLLAVCRSEVPGRETVSNVKRVRYRVHSAERTSRLGDLKF
jgi:hypothetical protein